MDENNVHTSVVIELANQEEPEDQNTYRIDIDDVESPKDYVIDQIFCGENVTVYALFEVPEGTKFSDKSLINMPNPNLQDNYKFFHKSSYKEVINEKNMNRFKSNSSVIHCNDNVKFLSDRGLEDKSLYCLKHLGSDYGMLTPEKKNSELKILYSKETVSQSTKSMMPKGLKFQSKGVNTDIVQSPRIMEDVQRAVGVNIPFVKNKEKNVEDSCTSFSKSSYEVIEMEMQQSYSSVNSDSGKKTVSNYFIVPLLLMENGTLSHCEKIDKSQKLEEEKLLCSKKIITRKVSLGTNTDINFDSYKKTDKDSNDVSQFESYKTDSENNEDRNLYVKKENSNEKLKINSKETIIKEIKIMQRKLNILIKSIESNDFVFNEKENESNSKTINDRTENLERMSEPLLNETCQKKCQKLDDRPIFLPFRYPSYPNKEKPKTKKRSQSINESKKSGTSTAAKKSLSNNVLPNDLSYESIFVRNDQAAEGNQKKLTSNYQMNCLDLENRKTFSSKSESCVRVIISAPKHNSNNSLKKSQSFDLKCDKIEALKKTKNFSNKVESSIKTKTNVWIHPNKERPLRNNLSLMKCEMGDDVNKKPINTANKQVLSVIQVTEKTEKSEKLENSGFEKIVADVKKNFCKEEGDAKLVYPKETLVTANVEKVQVHYHYASVIPPENLLKPIKSPRTVISKTSDKSSEVGTKISSVVEKPVTPKKSSRKINTTDSNAKKDVKINKKINSKVKVVEKVNKPEVKDVPQSEIEKKKALTGSRKSTRHNAESKLHIDKLIKLDNLGSNFKATFLAKSNHNEKPEAKTERAPRPISQKQERSNHPVDVFIDENVKEKSEIPKEKSSTLVQVQSFHKNKVEEKEEPLCPEIKEKMPEEANSFLVSENFVSLSTNPSSVVVELFSKKPCSVNEFHYEVDQENLTSFNLENATFDKNRAEKETNENSENMEKPIAKSVWALTKVLLYEDGTNKLEVLEASLTPPDYSLN